MLYSSFRHLIVGFCWIVCSLGLCAQMDVRDDFEGNGTITTWFGDDCAIDINFTNPFQEDINTSSTVLRYEDTGGQFANVRFDVPSNFDMASQQVFSIKIYVPSSGISGAQPNQVSLKLQDGNLAQPWITQSEIIKTIQLDQWQTVTFDFANDTYLNLDAGSPPPTQRTDFNRVVIQVNGENNNDRVLAYLDDIDYYAATNNDPIYDNLVWSDEFETPGALDASKWFQQTQIPQGGSWYNGEIQHYTNRIDNSFVENGVLKIVAKRETFTDQGVTKDFTSARLNSKFTFTYGKVEVRAKLPRGIGTWPAIWMLGKNINEAGAYWQTQGFGTTTWPACGEIDIMEHWGDNQNFVQSAIHSPSSFGNTVNKGGQTITTVSDQFHLYTLVWTPEKMTFSVDGVVHYVYEPPVRDQNTWPFDADQYLLFNVAILPNIEGSFTESALEIDYVRVYQEQVLSNPNQNLSATLAVYPNPAGDTLNIQLPVLTQEKIEVALFNIAGVKVKTEILSTNDTFLSVNIQDLPTGHYTLKYSMEGKQYTFKVLKN